MQMLQFWKWWKLSWKNFLKQSSTHHRPLLSRFTNLLPLRSTFADRSFANLLIAKIVANTVVLVPAADVLFTVHCLALPNCALFSLSNIIEYVNSMFTLPHAPTNPNRTNGTRIFIPIFRSELSGLLIFHQQIKVNSGIILWDWIFWANEICVIVTGRANWTMNVNLVSKLVCRLSLFEFYWKSSFNYSAWNESVDFLLIE